MHKYRLKGSPNQSREHHPQFYCLRQPPKCNHFPTNEPTTLLKAAFLDDGATIDEKFKNWDYAEHQPPRPNHG
ncbi:hypothetical protein [Photobacterium swingsii]|uniref:hypothetical protein n=1 Tax=Photobacterium swingsii TaxID=680026 RepID=UPI0040693F36